MTHSEKVDRLYSELSAKGFGKYAIAPPIFRLLWRIGIEVPPPAFIDFWSLALFDGLVFGGAMAVYYSFFFTLSHVLVLCGIAGGIFGLITSAILHWKVRGLHLPSWEDYGASN